MEQQARICSMDAPAMVGKRKDADGREPLHPIRDGIEWDLLPKERRLESQWSVRDGTLPGTLAEQTVPSRGIPSHPTFLADKSSNPHASLPPFFVLSCCSFFPLCTILLLKKAKSSTAALLVLLKFRTNGVCKTNTVK